MSDELFDRNDDNINTAMRAIDSRAKLTPDKLALRFVNVQFAPTVCTRSGRIEEQHPAIRLCRTPARKLQSEPCGK